MAGDEKRTSAREDILSILPTALRIPLGRALPDFGHVEELRLRAERPVLVQMEEQEYMVTEGGELARDGLRTGKTLLQTGRRQLQETLELIGNFSLYAAEEELRQGFFTIQGGHRIGVAGRTLAEGGEVRRMSWISCLNIRVAHEVKGCADEVVRRLFREDGSFRNTLIVSPPRGGKTTLLRDLIRQISNGHRAKEGRLVPGMTVGVVDERSELGACCQGVMQNDLGMRTDVLDCCPKSLGMMMLVRSMAPQVVAVDEIGGVTDADALAYAGSCGCGLAATIHGASLEELWGKPAIRRLLEEGMFERLIFLEGGGKRGRRLWMTDGRGRPLDESAPEAVCTGEGGGLP